MSETVIVRGMREEWFMDHFKDMEVYFGGDPRGIPKKKADYIGFYLEAPVSAVTHIGIVNEMKEGEDGTLVYFLRAIVKLDKPVKPSHPIRKHEYWTLADLGIQKIELLIS